MINVSSSHANAFKGGIVKCIPRVCAPRPAQSSQPKQTRRGQACPNCCNTACLRTCTDSARPRRAGVCDPILSRAQTSTATNCRAQIVFASCCARPGPKRRKNSMINREANTLNENVQKTGLKLIPFNQHIHCRLHCIIKEAN